MRLRRFHIAPHSKRVLSVWLGLNLCLSLVPSFSVAASQPKEAEKSLEQTLSNTPRWRASTQATADSSSSCAVSDSLWPEAAWWQDYNDPLLSTYIKQALEHNHDIGAAQARLAEARALTRQTRADQLPELSVGATYSRQRNIYNSNANNNTGGANNGFQVIAPNATTAVFNAPMRVAYEPDIWFRNWDRTHRSRLLEQAETEKAQATRLTVITDVATTYFNAVATRHLIEVFERATGIAKADEDAAKAQFELGLVSDDLVAQKKNQSARLEAQLSDLHYLNQTAHHQLAILTGKTPEQFEALPLKAIDDIALPSTLHIGKPAELLAARPDLRASERELAASKIDVRIARKAFLPSFGLSGQLGFTSLSIGSFSLETLAWNAVSSATQMLFSGGRRRAGLKAAKSRQDEALHNYQQDVLQACREVDDAIAGVNNATTRYHAFQEAEKSIARQNELQALRVELGALAPNAQYQQALQTLEATSQVIQGRLKLLTETVSLYKALGGGHP